MQSRRLIPDLLLPPDDPAGAKPRRDHRFLDRVSRHEVPKTPGNNDACKVYDPARVSHIPVNQSVLHPNGVTGSFATPDPDPSAGNVQRHNRWICDKMSPAPLNDHRGSEGLYCKGQKPKLGDSEKNCSLSIKTSTLKPRAYAVDVCPIFKGSLLKDK